MNASQQSETARTQEQNLHDTGQGLVTWASCSIFLIIIYALSFTSDGIACVLSIISHGTMVAVAFASVGSLVGFLFGIPRTLQTASGLPASNESAGKDAGKSGGGDEYHQSVNTNLEQISDWLTKILVGVGLTQLQHIPEKLENMAWYFKSGLGGNASIALVIILNAMVFGFFAGYLLTRLFLAGAFGKADRDEASLKRREQFAQGLTEAGAYSKAISTLEATLADVGPSTPKEVKRNIIESLVYNYLYVDPPTGFQKAIEYGRTYNDQEPSNPSPRIWGYLAAAYGQQYKWELDHDKRKDVLDGAKKNALDAVSKALSLEPRMKTFLRPLWDPGDPTKESSQEDDLEVFFNEPEFQKLLG